MILESAPKRCCQQPLLITATFSLPGLSSPSSKTRPKAGCAPSRESKPAVTIAPPTLSGGAASLRVNMAGAKPPRSSSEVL